MEYLKNNICKFEILFDLDLNIKKNLVCCSFFKLFTSQYKDFNLYINGLEKLYMKVYKEHKDENFTIRIFMDKSIYSDQKLYERLKKMNKLEIVLYSCSKYLVQDNLDYHLGLFGTLVRFFPMFDFENNDADIVIISDIDDYDYFEKSIENIKIIKSTKKPDTSIHFFKAGNITKNVLYSIDSFYKNIPNPYAVASNFISFERCDNRVIYDFLIQIEESDELLTKYQHKFESNTNLLTGNKFVYGFDEYFLNINYTNYIADTEKTIGIKFKWSVYGSLFWFLKKNKFESKQIELINKLLDRIYLSIGFKISKNQDFRSKFKSLEKIIYKKNDLSDKILFEFYKNFIESEKTDEYNFIFEKDIYKIIKKYSLFGIYDCEIQSYSSTNSNYFIILSEKKFSQEKINELKKIKYSLSRVNLNLNLNLNPIDKIDCSIEFSNNLSTNINIFVDKFNYQGKNIVIKKEIFNEKESQEYNFFIQYLDQIKKTNFCKLILLPERILDCVESNSVFKIYVFEELNFDYNNEIISKLNFVNWIQYTLEICLTLYYLNNYLKVYHNDLCYKGNLRNIMTKQNNKPFNLFVGNYNFPINSDFTVLIDFGQQSTTPSLRTWKFYNNKFKTRTNIKYISEVFIVYYYSFKIYFKYDDYWDTKYDDLYYSIQSKSKSLKNFDENIINFLLELYEKNKN